MNYRIWITITVTHAYFMSDHCGIELKVSDESAILMKKAGILFRKQFNNQWILLRPEDETGVTSRTGLMLKDGSKDLNFIMIAKSNDFFYYTDKADQPLHGDGWIIRDQENYDKSKKHLQIPITSGMITDTKQINITIPNREVCWEFILIPKYGTREYPVELKESKGKLIFTIPEEISFPGEKKAFRCVTNTQIPMKETYDYKINLWEKREKGELLLSNHIPHPKPTATSVINPRDMITSYFYF